MSAYVVAQIKINDPDEYKNYLGGFMPVLEKHGGKLLATPKNQTLVVEGNWAYPSTVIINFTSVTAAQAWLDDPDYQALAEFRNRSSDSNLVIVEGLS